jgi:tetraprenyl-beta-curcumene synthase
MSPPRRDLATTAWTLAWHRLAIRPAVRRELSTYEKVARAIPDPPLRETALGSLHSKAGNPDATAIFTILAPRRTRGAVLRASVALQVLIDHLDSIGERPEGGSLEAGLRSHAALTVALSPPAAAGPVAGGDDYVQHLVRRCQAAVARLPGAAALAAARGAAKRCGEGQSHTHAAALSGDNGDLRAWTAGLPSSPGYSWWELAAGGSSSVATHALIAAAGRPRVSAAEAAAVDSAYDPAVGALTVLLDDLVDHEADAKAGEHNYLDLYPDRTSLAERLLEITRGAHAATARLPGAARHRAILAGVVAYYLSDPGAARSLGAPAVARLLAAAGPAATPLARMLGALR